MVGTSPTCLHQTAHSYFSNLRTSGISRGKYRTLNRRKSTNRNFPKRRHRFQNFPETMLFSVSPTPYKLCTQFPDVVVLIGSNPPMATAEQRNGRSAASFYAILGVSRDASVAEIRAAYRKLAMKWHPDRCGWERVHEANRRFQQIQEAYEVLSDERRRAMYDAGLYDPLNCEQDGGVEDVEGFWDFVQEMVRLMAEVKSKQEEYTMEELKRMLAEMAEDFTVSPMPTLHPSATAPMAVGGARMCEPIRVGSRSSKRYRSEAGWVANRSHRVQV